MFKERKTKPKYSIRKYSIGAASALIGFMTLANGQAAQADEAQSISDLTDASNQAQTPQTASRAQLATSEPASVETVQASQPANIAPVQPQVTTVQAAEQTPTIDQLVEASNPQTQETSVNVLTNATEDQGQAKEYSTEGYGAKMPYTTHEAENASVENGATIQQSTDMESTAVEATNQTYVELPKKNAAVTFNVTEPANALNVRYTIPDGASGQLDVQVNGSSVGNLDLSSHSAWQYLKGDHEYDQAIDGSSARFRFDETRLLLKDIQLKSGDKISLVKKKDDNVPYGIDFIELEQAPAPVAQGENSISIVDKGASANDDSDDTAALLAAVEEAKASGKSVYIPEGRFNFDKQVNIEADNLKISGAGVWHTQLHFTSDKRYGGGIVFGHNSNGIELSNLYMDSNLTSRYNEDAQYKAISGTLGKDSKIHDIWVQHFEVGMWIGDYDQTGNMKYTDGLVVENARIRNNLADGINFAQGTKNSTVKNSNIRGNGDDGLAIWSSISDGTNAAAEENNKFLNNTIESGWRAAGIGIFGGKGHEISGNLIKDVFAGAGIRVNTVFAGHNFDLNDSGIKIHDNTILRSGTTNDLYNLHRGAIDFQQVRGTIKNVDVYDNKLLNTLADPVITKNFEMGDNGNGEIRLSNNTIDNKATIVGAVSTVSPTKPEPKPVNNPVSETSVSETPKSEGGSSTPVSEVSNSEVISETSVSEAPKSEASSSTPVSEASTSEVISESSVSETPKSEVSSSAPVSEISNSEVISESSVSETPKSEESSSAPVSETSTSEVVSETSVSETPKSEASSSAPVSETSNSEVISETSVSGTPKSAASSSAPVSETSNSEVISETSVSETPKSEASSSTPVSEASNSEVISETSVSETPKSEGSSTAPASESPKNEETSVASSTSQVDVAITSDSPEKSPTSESTQKDPISEVSSEVIEKGSTSQVDVKVSEAPTTARTSEVVSILPNSQVAYNNDLKTPVTSSQLASEAIRFNSLLNEKSVDVIASKVMAVMASETLASEAASLTSSEGVAKEISSDLSELAESKKDDTPKNVARIDKATEAKQVAKSSESQASTSKEKGKSNTTTVFLLVGVAAALSISTVYLTKQGKKAGK
ncbi:YSIRK-type signal peptide-containing protein [Streptococcus salivarius]|uniref:YSIRK-type signal peptide-containing protein n=1 Tax=Streptococcus salivarius TaxID=1304 RepID=UPI0007E47777|nr:YSIRK-type signal peptide-containing protein [Streptococcus salivarius]MBS6273740.1 YSIRK-type signal peptide-containing protein [Streptococcus salivarius]MCY7055644.1 YSIRK-type signal peptide-containing protein [Streptococcus salivarius]MDU2326080.1 glycosyl hydrolase family 28-related protein [Streptococcus salivarius]MTQ91132.1 YSIRK-type signal peptide-containing protein [Streptococcus salivarius]PKZ94986.1 alpha-1,3-glucanase [Streptococcus salivarius]